MKTCSKCKCQKETNKFSKRKDTKDGLNSSCKLCVSSYYEKNKKIIKSNAKDYHQSNPFKIKEYKKIYYKKNKDKLLKYQEKYYNSEDNKLKKKKYFIDNKERINQYIKHYNKNRRNSDPLYKLSSLIRSNIGKCLKYYNENKNYRLYKTEEILGCSFEEFQVYLESKFEPWMSWQNQGKYNGEFNYGWDIDHIIPISSAQNEEEIYKLNYYTNLQPLCSKTNRYIKRNKWI